MSPQLRSARRVPDAPPTGSEPSGRPVMLATLAVPFEPESAQVAIQAAIESGVKLVVVDAVEMAYLPQCWITRRADIELDEDREEIRRLVGTAHRIGLHVEHLRIRSPRPVDALLEVAADCNAALLVLGPDRSRLKPRRFAQAARKIRRRASCLLWVAGEGP